MFIRRIMHFRTYHKRKVCDFCSLQSHTHKKPSNKFSTFVLLVLNMRRKDPVHLETAPITPKRFSDKLVINQAATVRVKCGHERDYALCLAYDASEVGVRCKFRITQCSAAFQRVRSQITQFPCVTKTF